MAFVFTVNQTPATGAVHMWNMILLLKTAGWTQQDSSDGTTRATNQVTSGASGTNGLANTSAWVRIRNPAGTTEMTFQRSTTNLLWRWKISNSVQFTGGTPSATQTPSATDEQILYGGGTDASPTYSSVWAADAGYRAQYCADNASPYGFYTFTYANGGGLPNGAFVMEPLASTAVGDTQAYVFMRGLAAATTTFTTSIYVTTASPTAIGTLARLGTTATTILACPGCTYSDSGGVAVPALTGTNPITTKDDGLPIVFIRKTSLAGAAIGYKGISTMSRWNATLRTTGDVFTVVSTLDYISAGDIRLPWDGTTTPVL